MLRRPPRTTQGERVNIRIGIRAVFAAACLLASAATFAAGPAAVRKQAEASMLVTGKIQIDTTGKVTGYTLDHKDKLPSGVVRLLDQAVPNWTFEPVLMKGKAVNASTDMSIRVVAKKDSEETYSIGIRGASFGDNGTRPEEQPQAKDLSPPDYPELAVRAGVTGTVYLLLRIGRDGQVNDVIAEQTNLGVVDDEKGMDAWRRRLEDVSIRQSRKWKFVPPSQGESADEAFWVVRVPVVYSLGRPPKNHRSRYGVWEGYIPGPRHPSPWGDNEGLGFSPDTLAPGDAYPAGSGLRLKTALSGI